MYDGCETGLATNIAASAVSINDWWRKIKRKNIPLFCHESISHGAAGPIVAATAAAAAIYYCFFQLCYAPNNAYILFILASPEDPTMKWMHESFFWMRRHCFLSASHMRLAMLLLISQVNKQIRFDKKIDSINGVLNSMMNLIMNCQIIYRLGGRSDDEV